MSENPTTNEKKEVEKNNKRQAERTFDNHYKFTEHLNRAMIESGILAIRSALLINGGAAIATLAYVGTLSVNEASIVIDSLLWFAWGVAAAASGAAFAYVANFTQVRGETSKDLKWEHPFIYSNNVSDRWLCIMNIFITLAILAGAASLIWFICGMYEVKNTISSLHSITK